MARLAALKATLRVSQARNISEKPHLMPLWMASKLHSRHPFAVDLCSADSANLFMAEYTRVYTSGIEDGEEETGVYWTPLEDSFVHMDEILSEANGTGVVLNPPFFNRQDETNRGLPTLTNWVRRFTELLTKYPATHGWVILPIVDPCVSAETLFQVDRRRVVQYLHPFAREVQFYSGSFLSPDFLEAKKALPLFVAAVYVTAQRLYNPTAHQAQISPSACLDLDALASYTMPTSTIRVFVAKKVALRAEEPLVEFKQAATTFLRAVLPAAADDWAQTDVQEVTAGPADSIRVDWTIPQCWLEPAMRALRNHPGYGTAVFAADTSAIQNWETAQRSYLVTSAIRVKRDLVQDVIRIIKIPFGILPLQVDALLLQLPADASETTASRVLHAAKLRMHHVWGGGLVRFLDNTRAQPPMAAPAPPPPPTLVHIWTAHGVPESKARLAAVAWGKVARFARVSRRDPFRFTCSTR